MHICIMTYVVYIEKGKRQLAKGCRVGKRTPVERLEACLSGSVALHTNARTEAVVSKCYLSIEKYSGFLTCIILKNKYKYNKNLIISLILPSLVEEVSLLLTLSFELPKHIQPDSFTEQVTELSLTNLIHGENVAFCK